MRGDSSFIEKRIRPVIDLSSLCHAKTCVVYDLGRFLAEEKLVIKLPIGIEYDRQWVELYAHKEKDRVKIFRILEGQVLEYVCRE